MNVLSRHRTKSRALAGLVASAFLLAGVGRADSVPSQTRGTATIGFPFVAGSTQCPAGSYSFEAEGNKVTLRAVEPKGPTVILLVVTRLGRHDKDANPEFVFDKVGDQPVGGFLDVTADGGERAGQQWLRHRLAHHRMNRRV